MLGTDGKELRQRAVSQPVSQPGVYQEEAILKRRAKMAEQDRTPIADSTRALLLIPLLPLIVCLKLLVCRTSKCFVMTY